MIINPRFSYLPFEYEKANDFTEKQQATHWLRNEVPMSSDLVDWDRNLNDSEKNVIGNILKGFVQAEVLVNDFWTQYVTKWFPKPEIRAMAITFGSFEVIHTQAYALLNESLNLLNFEGFLEEETVKAKLDFLLNVDNIELTESDREVLTKFGKKSPESIKSKLKKIASALAIFSAFTEGVNIFSSFAVLLSFQTRNMLKGVGQIVTWSVRDESLHSKGGCWLFNQLCEEFPWLRDEVLKCEIEEAAKLMVQLEDDFINKVFELGSIKITIDGKDILLSKDHLKNFIRLRTNNKLQELNYAPIFNHLDKEMLSQMVWFDSLSGGQEFADFFATRVTEYSKGNISMDRKNIFG